MSGAVQLIDETGNTYGNLSVIERDLTKGRRDGHWRCKCACGRVVSVKGYYLRSGKITACSWCRKE